MTSEKEDQILSSQSTNRTTIGNLWNDLCTSDPPHKVIDGTFFGKSRWKVLHCLSNQVILFLLTFFFLSIQLSIDPFSVPLVLHRVMRNHKSIPDYSEYKAGDTLDHFHHRAQSHIHSYTHSHNLEMPNSLQHISLDWGRKPEFPEDTSDAQRKQAKSIDTGWRWDSNAKSWRCEANVVTTVLPRLFISTVFIILLNYILNITFHIQYYCNYMHAWSHSVWGLQMYSQYTDWMDTNTYTDLIFLWSFIEKAI